MNNIPSTTSIFLSRQHLLHPTEKMTGKEARDLASASTEEKVMIAVAYTLIALTGIGLIAIGVYFWKARAKVTQLKTSDFPRVPRPQPRDTPTAPTPAGGPTPTGPTPTGPTPTGGPKPKPAPINQIVVGMKKGIQGNNNTCALDSLFFSMFAGSNKLNFLFEEKERDSIEVKEVREYLRQISEGLHSNHGFVGPQPTANIRKILLNDVQEDRASPHVNISEVIIPRLKQLLSITDEEIQDFILKFQGGKKTLEALIEWNKGEVKELSFNAIRDKQPKIVFLGITRFGEKQQDDSIGIPTEIVLNGVQYVIQSGSSIDIAHYFAVVIGKEEWYQQDDQADREADPSISPEYDWIENEYGIQVRVLKSECEMNIPEVKIYAEDKKTFQRNVDFLVLVRKN